ncbi:cellulose biosynthesis protein BcsN [Roseiarcaceae bacterium H3SJ34-1]|uniref:cellulose biosynthesis protein BcsN n=1 Tax=Terripilifer ovatus TaxID=3032367 RepID=UPI003AB98F64|nr:cellulose biosynthesis protein BcsN [Roseiarcaceae bacterium H3SJ34-1]
MKRYLVKSLPPCFLLPLVLTLGACGSSTSESRLFARDESPAVATIPVASPNGSASFAQALMLLPIEAGAVTRIRERHYANGSRQEIVMGWDAYSKAEDILEVSIETDTAQPGGRDQLQMSKPSERGIRTEILARFPNTPMNIVTRPMQNAFGTFGLAIGKQANGARCIFAWQWIDDMRSVGQNRSGFAKMGSLISGRGTPASIRVRLCHNNTTVDQLAGYVEALQMGEPDALMRILAMDRKSLEPVTSPVSALSAGRVTAVAVPVNQGTLESALNGGSAPRQAAAPRAKSKPARRAAARPPKDDDEAQTTTRPMTNPMAAPAPVEPQAAPMITQQQPTGPRYLAPVPQQQGGVAGGPVPQPQQRLNTSLPPQAYRGPATQDPYRPPSVR